MSLYSSAVDLFIRPHRSKYTLADLGSANITFAGKRWHREDCVVPNDRGQLLQASWWRLTPSVPRPCVIYLHTNSGCRTEALDYLPLLMKLNITMLAFDFAGSGNSEGEFVSLGAWEKKDVGSVLAYVLGSGQATSIALWGRSMGAATALLAADIHRRFIRAVIADSSFASLPRLVQDVAQGRSMTPKPLVNMLVSLGLKVLNETIKQRAHFRIAEVDPLSVVENSTVPTLYMHADRDGFIVPDHSRDLHARQRLENKRFLLLSGDHNGIRGALQGFDAAAQFLFDNLLTAEERTTLVTVPRLNLISSSLYYVVRQVAPANGMPAQVMAKELPLAHHSPLVAAVQKNMLRLALVYSDEVVLEQPFNVATDLRWEEGGIVAFHVTRVVLPIPVRYAFASADARELYAMLATAITPAPGGAPPPLPPPPSMLQPLQEPALRPDSWEAADPSFAQLLQTRKNLSDSDSTPTRSIKIPEGDMRPTTPIRSHGGNSPPAEEPVPVGSVQELERTELDANVSALVATEQCVWAIAHDGILIWDAHSGTLLERRRLLGESPSHLLPVGHHIWLFSPFQISVWAAKLLEPLHERSATMTALLPTAARRDWKPMHVVLRGAEVILYKRKEDTDMAFRLGLKGAAIQRSTHPDFKFILLLREAAPVGSKASALLGMTAEPLLLAAKSDEELNAWFTAVQTACAAIDTGRCQYIRSIESGCRGVSALLEAEGRVWIASAEKPVLRLFDSATGVFKSEIAYQPPDPASTDVISCLCYHKDFMWAALGRDILRGSAADFGQRKVLSGHHARISHIASQENLVWRYSTSI